MVKEAERIGIRRETHKLVFDGSNRLGEARDGRELNLGLPYY